MTRVSFTMGGGGYKQSIPKWGQGSKWCFVETPISRGLGVCFLEKVSIFRLRKASGAPLISLVGLFRGTQEKIDRIT